MPFGLLMKLMRTLILPQFNTKVAKNRVYISRQHLAVLALLHAAFHYSQFRDAIHDAYRRRLPYEFHVHTTGCALSITYLKARESASRTVIKCISRYVILSELECRAAAVYTEALMHVRLYRLCVGKLPEHVKADSKI